MISGGAGFMTVLSTLCGYDGDAAYVGIAIDKNQSPIIWPQC